ncbi:putative receptor-like protein kinase At3g47110 [Ricinus communis]|uniref:putative receptor-like protein kinase At3g47110 n=1 Tax=Ricinus communis TaxID=3988 RepID=UPI00077297E0|nr:putative receptor-like protein kinase At3g47110 [Ricinus communis]|eukprot:XP_015579467.1 putative receptor-like protein kinase At3g47110 [Ricinus communis]
MELEIHLRFHVHVHVHVIFVVFASMLYFQQAANCLSLTENDTDRLALLEFKAKIVHDPHGIFDSWNDSVNFCEWRGVTCGHKHRRVSSLNLRGLSLLGSISPYIRNLTFLRFLNFANNRFHGEIPQEIGHLFRLRHLNLRNNSFGGEIPGNISYCSKLRIINFEANSLVGEIPDQLGSLKKLVTLFLGVNNLTGRIPLSIGNLSSLKKFSAPFNKLEGDVPNELGLLKSLRFFGIGANYLTGTIPATLYNISSIIAFSAPANQLNGSLPANIGNTLPNLQRFGIGANQFHGSIPISFTNASQLKRLDISGNIFTGGVPINLGNLQALQWLNLEFNLLGRNTSKDLSFIKSLSNCSNLVVLYFDANNFGGQLPSFIGNLSNLQELGIGSNHISGEIPEEIGNLINLYILGLEKNLFSSTIPVSLGKLYQLQLLYLDANILSGQIPPSLGNISQLYEFDLSVNKLEGNITASLGNCQHLGFLDLSSNDLIGIIPQQFSGLFSLSILNLSQNSLTGPVPLEIGKLKNINALDVSENKLSGKIPETIGDCLSLEILNVQGNFFEGPIPSSFVSLRGLQHLDLSRNNLSGKIPKDLEQLPFLQYLNISFNNFDGEVPKGGVFSNVNAFSFVRNGNLCGGSPELQLPACPEQNKKRNRSSSTVIILATTISSFLFFLTITSFYVFRRRIIRMNQPSSSLTMNKLPKVSYKELLQATGGFSSDNLIGQGSFGSVYKGILHERGERLVAVKVLNLQQYGASKSFIAECKALRSIRHRNLVKILTYCSSIDFKGNDFKALVFDFMANGSLDIWLHQEESGTSRLKYLNFLQRLHIATDVSSALYYLHEHCETPVIHCDLKPSNILLDDDMTARIGDFGLARLLSQSTNDSSQGQTSSFGIKGTIGYMAPEYGMGSEATAQGDVYSFGIILLEMFTGKRPTDEEFTDGLNLHEFVKAKFPGRVMEAVDPKLITREDAEAGENIDDDDGGGQTGIEEDIVKRENMTQEEGNVQNCIESVLEIGLACSAAVPTDRMSMKDVTRNLSDIMDTSLRFKTPQVDNHHQ